MDNEEEHLGIPRLMWESDHEWKLRTLFTDANMDYYKGDRLGALSMTWANWKFMGCTYGESVQGNVVINLRMSIYLFISYLSLLFMHISTN